MEGPNGRWKTEDAELTRIRRHARGESSLGWGSGCSAENLIAPPEDLFAPAEDLFAPAGESPARRGIRWLRLLAAPSAAHSAARRREPSARRSVRPLRPRAGAFAARIVRSASCPPASGTGMPAPAPICPLGARSAVSGARFVVSGADPLSPESDLSSPASDSSAPALECGNCSRQAR